MGKSYYTMNIEQRLISTMDNSPAVFSSATENDTINCRNTFSLNIKEIMSENIKEITSENEISKGTWHRIICTIINYNMLEELIFLLENIKIDPRNDCYGKVFIGKYLYCDNYEMLKILIEYGLDINRRIVNEEYNYLICAQCYGGRYKIVKLLIESGADINIPDNMALSCAVSQCNENIVKLLIESGIDINGENDQSLMIASRRGYTNIIKLLLFAGINMELYGEKASILATQCGQINVVKLLIDHGFDINYGNCAVLRAALIFKRANIIEFLLQNGISMDIFNTNQMYKSLNDPLASEKNSHVLKILLENGADPLRLAELLW